MRHEKPRGAAALSRGFVVVVDQAAYSLSTLVAAILVARNVSLEHYGQFVLATTLLVTSMTVQRGLITVPYTVCRHRDTASSGTDVGTAVVQHLLWSSFVLAMFFGGAALTSTRSGVNGFGAVLVWAGLACSSVLLRDLFRSVFLARLQLGKTLLLGISSNAAFIVTIIVLHACGVLDVPTVFIAMAASAFLPAVVAITTIDLTQPGSLANFLSRSKRSVAFGSWLLYGTVATAVGLRSVPWLLLLYHGHETVALMGALATVAGVIRPAILGLSSYLTARLAVDVRHYGLDFAIDRGLGMIRWLALGLALYIIIIATIGDWVVQVAFTESYAGYELPLMVLAVAVAAEAVNGVLRSLARATSMPRIELYGGLATTIACLLVGPVAIYWFGLTGAAVTTVAGNLAFTATVRWAIARTETLTRKKRHAPRRRLDDATEHAR